MAPGRHLEGLEDISGATNGAAEDEGVLGDDDIGGRPQAGLVGVIPPGWTPSSSIKV